MIFSVPLKRKRNPATTRSSRAGIVFAVWVLKCLVDLFFQMNYNRSIYGEREAHFMIKSMTGFGRYEMTTSEFKICVEMKAVNHRYLDLSIKMPRKFNALEAEIRNLLKEYVQRGKVDVFISYENYTDETLCLKYNSALAAEYMDVFAKMKAQFGISDEVNATTLARYPEVLTMEQMPEDEEERLKQLSAAVTEAARRFVEARLTEGEKLRADLLDKLNHMEELVSFIEQYSPGVVDQYRRKLEDKVRELLEGAAIEEGRIAAEVTIYADKICVDEETVRLKSHIGSTRNELLAGGSVGRKLDFIAQEMNREANTILSKANDMEVSGKAIALKTEIEKIREQIQNIE